MPPITDDDDLLWVDPIKNTTGAIPVPTIADKSTMNPTWPAKMEVPSPIYGKEILWNGVGGPHNPMMDENGRVWVTTNIRPSANPDFCKAGSDSPFAKYFPINSASKQAAVYDPETKKFTAIDTCFNTHHLQFAYDKDNTLFFSNPGGQAFGWLNTRIFDETEDARKAMGWCPAYLDTNGDGKIDPAVDKRIPVNSYGAIVNPVDGSIWFAVTGPTPGHLLRVTLGSNPPNTCMAEVYEPPYYNPKRPGVNGYAPRGIDIDRKTGLIWTALSGSGELASFDRRKCKLLNGPTATGQQCPEGWTLYTAPRSKDEGRHGRQQRRFRILQLGGPIQHTRYGREYPDRDGHEFRFTASLRSQHKKVDGHARAISHGLLRKGNGWPYRRSQSGLEGPWGVCDIR